MAKSSQTNTGSAKGIDQENEASSKKPKAANEASGENASKYQPTEDANMAIQSLDPQDGLNKLFIDSIKDIYWAENHIVQALPKMINAATSRPLQDALSNHLEETKVHVQRLEEVFELVGKKPQAKKCDAMEGLSKEGEGMIEQTDSGTPARDLGIIMASQKVEHYEISSYNGLIALAGKLGLTDVSSLLSQTLNEEKLSDELLARVAEADIATQN